MPIPVDDAHPAYGAFYQKAWELAHDHVKEIAGMPQTPYMDEAFCDTQIWIWDTCFMTLFCKYARDVFPGVESLRNFYTVLHGEGNLPTVIPTEKEPAWTGAVVGEPFSIEVHIADNPPLFVWSEYENALFHGDLAYLRELLYEKRVLQKHFAWLEDLRESYKPRGVHAVTRWIACPDGYKWEGGRSGMDNTPRGKTEEKALKPRPNNPRLLWIDAICQQALSARLLARLFALVGDEEGKAEWERVFEAKKETVNRLYWDEKDGFYYDIDCNTHDFYKVMTPASFWALTAGIANREQAARMAKWVTDPNTLGGDPPLLSLSRNDPDFSPNGNYWRGGLWLPTAYAALRGLSEYGFYDVAREAGEKILAHMEATYREFSPHTVWECYSPTRHAPALNEHNDTLVRPDFCGWSALGPISIWREFLI